MSVRMKYLPYLLSFVPKSVFECKLQFRNDSYLFKMVYAQFTVFTSDSAFIELTMAVGLAYYLLVIVSISFI